MHLPRLGAVLLPAIFLVAISNLAMAQVASGDVSTNSAQDAWLVDLKSDVEAAKSQRNPITDQQIATSKAKAIQAANDLENYLRMGGNEIANGWKAYLDWPELTKQVKSGEPNSQVLGAIANKFYEGHVGLDRPKFVSARNAITNYVRLLAVKDPKVEEQLIGGQFDVLTAAIDQMIEEPRTITATQINELLNFMDGLGQLDTVSRKFRNHFNRPNLYMAASDAIVSKAIAQVVTETRPVSEFILGTHICGTATTTGLLSGSICSNSNAATIMLSLNGTTVSQTVGTQQPVRIYSTGCTSLFSQAGIVFNEYGLSALPATAQCVTKTRTNAIRSMNQGIGSRLIEKIAWNRVGQKKGQSESIASRRAEQKAIVSMNQRVREAVAKGNERLRSRFRRPLEERNVFPRNVRVSSSSQAIHIHASQGTVDQFLAPSIPPSMPQHRITAQIHESMISNSAINYMAGLKLTDELAVKLSKELTGSVPESLELKQDEDPWSITFDRQNPFVVEFHDGQIKIIIRGREFTRGDTSLSRLMEISANYAMSTVGGRLKLTRQGELEVTYPGKKGRLSVTDISERTFVQEKFKGVFEDEIVGGGVTLPENLAKLGPLNLVYTSSDNGWLSLGWN